MIRLIQPVSASGIDSLSEVNFENTVLSVVFADDGLSFLVCEDGEAKAFEKFNFETAVFNKIIEASALVKEKYAEVKIFIDNRFFSLMPANTATNGGLTDIGKTLFGNKDLEMIKSADADYDYVFGVEKTAFELIRKKWKNADIHHFGEAFLKVFSDAAKGGEEVFFDIRDKWFRAALFRERNLVLFNSYEFSGRNDFGFFALGVIKNTGFDNKTLKLYLTGKVEDDAPLSKLLKKYVATVQNFDTGIDKKEFEAFFQLIKYLKK